MAMKTPEVMLIEADHDLRNPADFLVLNKLAKAVLAVGKGSKDAGETDAWRENRKLRAAINEYCRQVVDRP